MRHRHLVVDHHDAQRGSAVYRNRLVTRISRKDISYEISGPWYWLEQTVFQQAWITTDSIRDTLMTLTTTRGNAAFKAEVSTA